jgi:hypothetical protein
MINILNKNIIDDKQIIKKIFSQNQPFKHVVIEDFFTKDFCQKLLEEFPSFDEKLATNENGEIGRKAVHEHVSDLGSSYKTLDGVVKSEEFISLIEVYTGIKGLKYDPHYFGGGTHNNLDGQDLDPHVDFTHHPISGQHRRMNLIVYLNKEWNKEWGGNIELHKNPRLEPDQDEIISVEPLFNRAVLFETNDISWHGFPRITLPEGKKQMSRKSFALYYYTDSRETKIKPHSTIYVERHLPERIQAGSVITAEDLQEIKVLLKRRDQHLERLYGYITGLTEETSGLKYLLQQSKIKNKNLTKQEETQPQQVDFNESRLLARIYDLENSTSWKITAPLRKLVNFFKR